MTIDPQVFDALLAALGVMLFAWAGVIWHTLGTLYKRVGLIEQEVAVIRQILINSKAK